MRMCLGATAKSLNEFFLQVRFDLGAGGPVLPCLHIPGASQKCLDTLLKVAIRLVLNESNMISDCSLSNGYMSTASYLNGRKHKLFRTKEQPLTFGPDADGSGLPAVMSLCGLSF